jgi:hypothetical protein
VSLPQEHENSKTTKIEGLPMRLEGQDHQEKGHTNLMCDSQKKSRKETPPKASDENPKKSSENHQKGKTGETTNSLEESRRIFYTCEERFIQGLACLLIIHHSLKISP